ncbi:MAG: TolC family protein [Deltaproteobacteria bacterium]|nr:TolC family protein [Deltaproteobacteria bacterium]
MVLAARNVRACLVLASVLTGLLVQLPSAALAAEPPRAVFHPRPDIDLGALTRLVVARSAAMQAAQLELEQASAEVHQSKLLENPAGDFAWGTVPVGESNPPGLDAPYLNVPNYGVGLSYRFLLGKRGPRQERAKALEGGARAMRDSLGRQQALALVRLLGVLAIASMRADGAQGILDDAKRSLELVKSRLAASFGTELDVDRLQIEVNRVENVISRSEGEISASLAECAAALGTPCEGFGSREEAKAFLKVWVDRGAAMTGNSIEERPDIRALAAYEQAAQAELSLARAQSIPDPTVRVGFLHDRFTVSGNQRNSFNLTVVVPLPVFDHGQAQAEAAASRQARVAAQRQRLLESARARIPMLRKTLEIQRKRERAIANEMLPRARAVLQDLERAAANRLVALTDVIQARRTVHELMGEEADSIGNAFEASLELISQLPGSSNVSTEPPQGAGP